MFPAPQPEPVCLIKKNRIDVAVFPVAGRGTRFLPATKASPKEMLPIVDKPLIQYAVEEALEAGRGAWSSSPARPSAPSRITSTPTANWRSLLLKQGKSDLLNTLRSVLPSYASCIYIRQPAPLGLGHAVLCAKPAVGTAPFFVHLADDLIDAKEACLKQMADRFDNGSIVAVQTVPKSDTDKYGIVKTGAQTWRPAAHGAHRREAEAGAGAVEPRRGRPLPAHATACSRTSSASVKARAGNPAHRRHRAPHERRGRVRVHVRRQALRLRQQARLPAGQRRVRTGAPGAGQAVPQLPARPGEGTQVIDQG
jgi:hypothetical protein